MSTLGSPVSRIDTCELCGDEIIGKFMQYRGSFKEIKHGLYHPDCLRMVLQEKVEVKRWGVKDYDTGQKEEPS